MAKGGRRKGGANKRRQQGRRPPALRQAATVRQAPAQNTATPSVEIETLREEAETTATAEDKAALTTEPRPDGVDLDRMWKMASEARDLFKAQEARHSALVSKAETQQENVAEKEADVAKRASELDERASRLDKGEASLDDRTHRLGEQEIAIREREADADLGFEEKRREMLSKYDEVIEKRRETLGALEGELHEREDELEEKARKLDGRERKLRWAEEDVQEQQADLEERVDRRVAARHEEYESKLAAVTAERDQARADRDRHAEELAQREEADRRFGRRSPDELLKELDALRAKNRTLHEELAERPDATATQRLDDLVREQQSWQAERVDLTRQVAELKRLRAYADNDSGEREAQRDRIASLVSQRELLHKANEELKAEVGELIDRADAQSTFPACIEVDEDPDLRRTPQTDGVGSLRELAEHVRGHMASDDLYYNEADVRSFIAGLAMGRLILLQGISGTGKTSLPIAFARAVGTEASVIEVQAGWRDPQDLVGHYNSFEKRFHEKEFLKALYRAGTPRWQDTIQIVLLDEMNLSYPEQYFSDMLSTLELRPDQQRLDLMPHAVSAAPDRFEEGSKLAIPPNVWFVGTANHDETTMNFADKTYDRAHVMEFPNRPERFDAERPDAPFLASLDAFQQAVQSAVQAHEKAAQTVWSYLESLRDHLAKDFDIGWGPRLERQMQRYVPVVIAAGGTEGEAGDHLLAMRLLRKIKDRHSNRPEHLEALKDAIEKSWFDKRTQPTKSIRLLKKELARLGHDVDSEA